MIRTIDRFIALANIKLISTLDDIFTFASNTYSKYRHQIASTISQS